MSNENSDADNHENLAYDPEVGWEPSAIERLDRPPVEVFEAIDGNRQVLADYLRSGQPLSLYTLEAIAAWMMNELPVKRPPGNPHGTRSDRVAKLVGMRRIEIEYHRRFLARGRPAGEADAIAEEIVREFYSTTSINDLSESDAKERAAAMDDEEAMLLGILEKFLAFKKRARSQRPKIPEKKEMLQQMYLDWKAQR